MRGWCLLAVLVWACPAWADTLRLKDGSSLEGTVQYDNGVWRVTHANGAVTQVDGERVQSVEKTGDLSPDGLARTRLASLRRWAEGVAEPRQAVDRYRKFLEQNPGMAAAAEAEKDLGPWQDRSNRGLQKFGVQWVTAEEFADLQRKATTSINQARDLIRDNHLKDADAILLPVLSDNPDNAAALYLRSLLLYRQNQIAPSRKAMEQLRVLAPEHAPTLNNLAVLLWRQNQRVGALTVFELAMAAAPQNKTILDNVAEVLYGLSDSERKTPQAQKAQRRFDEQDMRLSQQMEQWGWFRWGAGWVNQQQREELKKAEADIQVKVDELKAEYDRMRSRIGSIGDEIRANDRAMQRMEADRTFVDAQGRVYLGPLPVGYYRLQRDNEVLDGERKDLVRRMDGFRGRSAALQQSLPVPRYTGIVQPIDVEGMPALNSPPATQPQPDAPPPATLPAPAAVTPSPDATTSALSTATQPAGTQPHNPLDP